MGTRQLRLTLGGLGFIKYIDDKCLMYMAYLPETIVHRVWDCKITRRARDYTIGIINTMKAKSSKKSPWQPLDWQQGIFWKKVPLSISKLLWVWLLLRGVTIVDQLGGNE